MNHPDPRTPRPKLATAPWPTASTSSIPAPITRASVGKFLTFAVAILLNVPLNFFAIAIGYKLANPTGVGESFNLIGAMLMIGAAIACPLLSLSWLRTANRNSPTFRWETLAIPLLYVPMIAGFCGIILGISC